ncbi:hypothetical protein [Rhodococcus aerolatus]
MDLAVTLAQAAPPEGLTSWAWRLLVLAMLLAALAAAIRAYRANRDR